MDGVEYGLKLDESMFFLHLSLDGVDYDESMFLGLYHQMYVLCVGAHD